MTITKTPIEEMPAFALARRHAEASGSQAQTPRGMIRAALQYLRRRKPSRSIFSFGYRRPGSHLLPEYQWQPRSERWDELERARRRAAADPSYRPIYRQLQRAHTRAKRIADRMEAVVLHIARRYHHTEEACFVGSEADFALGSNDRVHRKKWPYKGRYKSYPKQWHDAGLIYDSQRIEITTYRGETITIPMPPKRLIERARLDANYPVGLLAVPVDGQPDTLACMAPDYESPRKREPWMVVGFAHQGHLVPESYVRGTLTAADIEAEENTETRRLMLEKLGQAEYIRQSGATPVHSDDWGTLYQMPANYRLLHLLNSTPNPDGTVNEYWIPVPVHLSTAHQAVAWTYGLTEHEYFPVQES